MMKSKYYLASILCLFIIFSALPWSSTAALAMPDTLPYSKTATDTRTLSGMQTASAFPATITYNDGIYKGTLTRQDTKRSYTVRMSKLATTVLYSAMPYPNDLGTGQYTFPDSTAVAVTDSVSGQTFVGDISKSGSPYFTGAITVVPLTFDHHGYKYDPDGHTALGYESNNTITYFSGSYYYANTPRIPMDYYGPEGQAGLGWTITSCEWDGAIQDATQEPWLDICMNYYGVALFESDNKDNAANRYRKPVLVHYRRNANEQSLAQAYWGYVDIRDTTIQYSGTVKRIANTKPSVTITHSPSSPVAGGNVVITVTPSDPDGDSCTLTAKLQPMGADGNTPGTVTTMCSSISRACGQAYTYTLTGAQAVYYKVTATVTDPGSLTGSATDTFLPTNTNHGPDVSLSSDKPSYVEGDTAVFTAIVTDPDGDNLDVIMSAQDMGELGANPSAVRTVYSGTVASGSTIRYSVPYMIPHPLKVYVKATDPIGAFDSKTLTVYTIPMPVQGQVGHTVLWEQHRQDYNNWAARTGLGSQRPENLFFRGENFMLTAQTSQYLASGPVHVYIAEHPEMETDLTTEDGHNWSGMIPGVPLDMAPAQDLTFVFTNTYIDGTSTQDVVVVHVDTAEYWLIHQLF